MKKTIIIANAQPNIQDVITVTQEGYSFGITVMIAATAALLAVSLLAFIFHRSN